MATLELLGVETLDIELDYLKKCTDFTLPEARLALQNLKSSILHFEENSMRCWYISYLVSHGYGKLFGKMWSNLKGYLEKKKWGKDGYKSLDLMLSTYFSFTDSSHKLASELGTLGYIPKLLKGLKKLEKYFEKAKEDYSMIEVSVKSILFLLANSVARCSTNCKIYRNAGAYAMFQKYLKSRNTMVSVVSLIILAYIADETERDVLATSNGGVEKLVKWLQACVEAPGHKAELEKIHGSAKETIRVLNCLAVNDSNKREIQRQGGIPAIVQMLGEEFNETEQGLAAEAVWNLAFVESIRTSAELQEAVPYLDKLRKSRDKELRRISSYALWEINDNQSEVLPKQTTNPQDDGRETVGPANPAQVMISYQWDYKPIAENIRDGLYQRGYRVWFDETDLRDDILAAMADGVEKSDIILMLISEKYKKSQACRTEAEYAYKLKKKVIPLMVDKDYKHDKPNGWLGALLGTKLFYKFFTDNLEKTEMQQLLKALGKLTQTTKTQDEPDGPMSKPSPSNWSEETVQEWLKKMKLDNVCSAFDGHDGRQLEEMYHTLCTDPKELKKELTSGDGQYMMNAKKYRKFTDGLKKIFEEK